METVIRSRAHVARLNLDKAQTALLDGQAHDARALWNLLHDFFTFRQGKLASLKDCDTAIRQARKEIDWLTDLPAQAAQAVLKTYYQAWKNFWSPEHPAKRPKFKARGRARMSVDIPQGRDLQITRLNRRWGLVNLPKVGRVKFRWTKDLPDVTKAGPAGRITGARLVKTATVWDIVFRTETTVRAPAPHQGPKAGMDRGVNVPLALSTGEHLGHGPWLTDGESRRLLRQEPAVWVDRQRRHQRRPKPAPPVQQGRRTGGNRTRRLAGRRVSEASSTPFRSTRRTRAASCCVSSTGISDIHVGEHVNVSTTSLSSTSWPGPATGSPDSTR
ncbi:RNA-guided endonuclease InsQ/TnpB family protein [Streptosporangium roseum]|uniref:RNA-guided endonuclease InsQ/TnpB family protein n=1 Tax=Streptosporangium roseum TaxID=2001 RepID=UPI00332D93DC